MSNRRWLAGPWPLACLTLLALALPVLLSGCSRSGGGGPAPGPVGPVGDWGPIPPGPRGPGTVAIAASRTIEVRNVGGERTQTLRASVPFSWGETSDPNLFSIEGRPTAWLVLQRWPDRTVRIAQAQWTETVPAAATLTRAVVAQPTALAGPFVPHAVFAGGLPELGAEVQDAFGVVYDAAVAGPGDVVQETPLVRVRRWRVYHTAATGGIGRDFLTSTFYVTELRDQPVAIVDWLPGNDYLGADAPGSADPNLHALGGVDVDDVSFRCRGVDLTLPYRAGAEGVAAGVNGVDGYTRFSAMQQTWIADGQMRRYRFLLLRDDPAANAGARAAARATATLMAEQPLRPLCDHDSLRVTAALGLLGGPGPAPADAPLRAESDYGSWLAASGFGTWGEHGDPAATAQTGTPRNHPLSPELAHAVQSRDVRLLEALEQKAWTQAVRPYHLHGLSVANDDPLFLWDGVPRYPGSRDLSIESLGRRALIENDPHPAYRTRVLGGLAHAHGFWPYDVEHFSMDLVFDYWTVTGDAWARDELRQLGENLRGILRPEGFFTSKLQQARTEGWMMQALVQAYLATDDIRFRDAALDRVHYIVDRDRAGNHPSHAITINGSDARTGWPEPHGFYMPWQHGAILYGYLAGWKFFGDEFYLTICDEVVRCVDYAWVRNVTQAPFGFVTDGLRYYTPTSFDGAYVPASHFDATHGIPFGDSPLGGAHLFLLAGLLMHSRIGKDAGIRALAGQYGELLLQAPLGDGERWNKWYYCLPPEWNP